MPRRELGIGPSLRAIIAAAAALIAGPATAQRSTSLDSCPARQPILRIAIVSGGESYSSHPAETRFSSTHFTRLHQMPLIGADPKEERIDAAYGVAESWSFLPGAKGMVVKLRDGLTFNDGTPITADDVVFSLSLSASKLADPQISGTLSGIGVTAKAIDAKTVQFDFAKGSPTFDVEISAMVFPLYVTSKAYHSNGEISQEAFDRFRAKPLAAGPYRVVARQAKESITLVADRRDPLLGCPVYDRIEIREVLETGTRINQFRTGQFDLISGSRDLVDQARSAGGQVLYKPDGNMIGLYFFQTDRADNVFHSEDLRKAAAYAIDHKLIAEAIWNNAGVKPWGCSWPPSTEISIRNPRFVKGCGTPYPYDPAKARAHLAAAGYPPRRGRAHQFDPVLRVGRPADLVGGGIFRLWTRSALGPQARQGCGSRAQARLRGRHGRGIYRGDGRSRRAGARTRLWSGLLLRGLGVVRAQGPAGLGARAEQGPRSAEPGSTGDAALVGARKTPVPRVSREFAWHGN
jgi:ABC-type transport system substrate-binding protein